MAENYYLNHTATQIDAILTKVDGIAAGANVNVQVDWNQTTTTADDYIKNKPTIPDAQIQSDWEQTNTESKDFIKNKPTIPAAQVNADWEASSGVAQILHKPTLGTAAAKDYTTSVSGLSDDLITSSAVNTALSTKANLVDGKVPASELPSYVDDTVEGYYYEGAFYEDSEHTTAITGERGKIYVDLTTNKSYRWTGAIYTRVDECPAFGETQGTIYEGNKGKANADAIAAIKDGTNIDSFADVETALELKANAADLGTAATADTTTSIASGGTGLPTSGTIYTDQQRQDTEIGSLVDRGAKNLAEIPSIIKMNTNPAFTPINKTYFKAGAYHVLFDYDMGNVGTFCLRNVNNVILLSLPNLIPRGQGIYSADFSITEDCYGYHIYGENTANISNIMICSKADWDASSVYVPYALDNPTLTAVAAGLVDKGAKNLSPVNTVIFTRPTGAAYTDPIAINLASGEYVVRYKLTTTANSAVAITYDGSEHLVYDSSSPYSDTVITHNFTVVNSATSFRFYFNQAATVSELMICTKADYDVSTAYIPYAPTNRELYEMILALQNGGNG